KGTQPGVIGGETASAGPQREEEHAPELLHPRIGLAICGSVVTQPRQICLCTLGIIDMGEGAYTFEECGFHGAGRGNQQASVTPKLRPGPRALDDIGELRAGVLEEGLELVCWVGLQLAHEGSLRGDRLCLDVLQDDFLSLLVEQDLTARWEEGEALLDLMSEALACPADHRAKAIGEAEVLVLVTHEVQRRQDRLTSCPAKAAAELLQEDGC